MAKKNGIEVELFLVGMRGASNLVDMQKFSQWKIEECHEKIGADGAVNDGYNEDDDFELQQILALSRDLK